MAASPKVGVLILTHNAPRYVHKTLASLRRTTGVDYDVIVLDNASRWPTRLVLLTCQKRGWINKLCFLKYNALFARGNNIAARLAEPDATHFLLLNSDVEIRDPAWLSRLLQAHREGISSYGVAQGGPIRRVDGYALLIDRHLYAAYLLDESFAWHWAVTKLQAQVLTAGHQVKGIVHHERELHHFGRKSGKAWRGAAGMNADHAEVVSWFQGRSIEVVE
jgi:glycosyltransferase involved in cell wall biosynthesis